MSKFLKKISELNGTDTTTPTVSGIEAEVDNADKTPGTNVTPLKRQIAQQAKQDRRDLLKKQKMRKTESIKEQDFVPRTPPPAAAAGQFQPAIPPPSMPSAPPVPVSAVQQPAEPLTTEGESFLVNLARKALFVDLAKVGLTDDERKFVNQDVDPKNSKHVEKILRKIVVDFGLGESFASKANVILEDLKKNDRVVVLVPGSFKPPHKGHYEMVKYYSEAWPGGHVHVLISAPSAKSERRTKDGKLITPSAAQQIFELYVEPLYNVTVSVSEYPSPVTAAYESLKELQPGTTVVLGASKKDDDWKRWSYAQSWAEKEQLGLNILDPAETAVDVTTDASGRPYSASNIRDNFDNFELIQQDIPDHVDPVQIKQVFDSL